MDPIRYQQFFRSKLELAKFLVVEKGDQAELDAEILLCCAISGLAAILWPGTGIDRQRFIEFLVEYSQSTSNLQLISTPVLASQLRDMGDTSSAIHLSRKFFPGNPSEEIKPMQVDQGETMVVATLSSVDLKVIRRASYASIIYNDLRCALVHEYSISPYITNFNLFGTHATLSYTNMTLEDGQSRRLLHIPFQYLADVLDGTAQAVFAYWSKSSQWERPRPALWWTDG